MEVGDEGRRGDYSDSGVLDVATRSAEREGSIDHDSPTYLYPTATNGCHLLALQCRDYSSIGDIYSVIPSA